MDADTFARPQDHEQDHDPWWHDIGTDTNPVTVCSLCGMLGE